MFVENILGEEPAAHRDRALPLYLQMVYPEVSSQVLTIAEEETRNSDAVEDQSLPLHLILTPPQTFGQLEMLSPEEMAEFQKEFATYNDVTQMAEFDPIRNDAGLTNTFCTQKDIIWTCGVGVPGYCNKVDDKLYTY